MPAETVLAAVPNEVGVAAVPDEDEAGGAAVPGRGGSGGSAARDERRGW